jgi:hypothetical protein
MSEPDTLLPPAGLYERIETEIARCAVQEEEATLMLPLFHVPSSDRDSMVWVPKALLPGVFGEKVGVDPVVAVETVRFSGVRGLYLRFRLKRNDNAPVRCVVVLNGCHSIRLSIGRGKIGTRRTYAEVLLDFDQLEIEAGQSFHVEIFRDSTLLYYNQIAPAPAMGLRWAMHYVLLTMHFLGAPFVSTWRMRPIRIAATRLLEESFRIKAN